MRNKAVFLTGFAAGYVLGARAGRQRYEQIVRTWHSVKANPKVQSATSTLSSQAGSALSTAKDKAGETWSEHKPGFLASDEPQPTGTNGTSYASRGGTGWSAGSSGGAGTG